MRRVRGRAGLTFLVQQSEFSRNWPQPDAPNAHSTPGALRAKYDVSQGLLHQYIQSISCGNTEPMKITTKPNHETTTSRLGPHRQIETRVSLMLISEDKKQTTHTYRENIGRQSVSWGKKTNSYLFLRTKLRQTAVMLMHKTYHKVAFGGCHISSV